MNVRLDGRVPKRTRHLSRIASAIVLAACATAPLAAARGGLDGGTDPESRTLCQTAIAGLRSADPARADAAYRRLYSAGSRCIGDLLALSGDNSTFVGRADRDAETCTMPMVSVRVSQIALYLVDAILVGSPTPHRSPFLLGARGESSDERLARAFDAYAVWWADREGGSLAALRRGSHPLAGTGLRWHGLVRRREAPANALVIAPKGEGTPVPGSETPSAPGDLEDVCIAQQNPYSWIFLPDKPGGPDPYNCFAWAIKCYTDRWVQPNPDVPGNGWKDILEDNGYDTGSTIDCMTQSCANGGTKVKMVWEVAPGDDISDDNWVHAMKQEAGEDWTSKNGEGPLYVDIKDCEAFVDQHYPATPPNTLVVKCFCPN